MRATYGLEERSAIAELEDRPLASRSASLKANAKILAPASQGIDQAMKFPI